MIDIKTIAIGQHVRMDGELGIVRKVSRDDHIIYVGFPTANGEDIIDLDPDEPGLTLVA
jgi:hypothetical protein